MCKNTNLRWLLSIPLVICLGACGKMDYMDTAQVMQSDFISNEQKYHLSQTEGWLKDFGAVVVGAKPEKPPGDIKTAITHEPDKPRVFHLKRHKDHVMAETMLFDNRNSHKSTFKESYFSIGADRDKRMLGLQLRFVLN